MAQRQRGLRPCCALSNRVILLLVIFVLVCIADADSSLHAIHLLNSQHAASKGQPLQGPGSIQQRATCNWIKVVSQHIDPCDHHVVEFLEPILVCVESVLFAHDVPLKALICSYDLYQTDIILANLSLSNFLDLILASSNSNLSI